MFIIHKDLCQTGSQTGLIIIKCKNSVSVLLLHKYFASLPAKQQVTARKEWLHKKHCPKGKDGQFLFR